MSSRHVCNADINEGARHREPSFRPGSFSPCRSAAFLFPEDRTKATHLAAWTRSQQFAGAGRSHQRCSGGDPASAIPELPAKSASDDSLATGVMRPAVVTPAIPAKDESRARDVLAVNASHTPMARLSPMACDSRIEPLTCNTSNTSTGHDTSLGSKACMTSHSGYTASSSHSSMESETHRAR